MSDTPDLGAPPERVDVSAELVGRLVAAQFPQWAGLPVTPVARGGWDNFTFHLGAELSVRMPSAAEYALAVEKEHRWLPELAPRLPLPVSTPVAKGQPGEGYPFPWSVYSWLDGETARADRIADPVRFAGDLAGFLAALRRVDPAYGPRPGTHNWFRGGTLRTFDNIVREALAALAGRVDGDLVAEMWRDALGTPWDGAESWLHGDVARGNLLVRGGRLAAVIDFGTCGVGDPACDLAVAWTLLTVEGRRVFRAALGVDDAEWARGRGWALWKTLSTCAYSVDDVDEDAEDARRVLDGILGEYAAGLA
ncbi:aminoglycoside phosphotransferase family protein [Longispora sp. NPDC051575]|uniref:aminoglycoside phosphotransferase family protein n=1 Tax=Longispora sp. NPDC051575 TaxID=3154943 RepID=UPI003419F2FA